jgi:hypothetical protein
MKRQKLVIGMFLMAISMINPGCTHKKPEAKDVYRQYINNKLFNT